MCPLGMETCLHSAGHDSETWGLATAEEFEPVPRLCRYILAVYEDDLRHPMWEPPGGYGINPDWVILRKTYEDTLGRAPPYILYLDHDHSDIVLAIRGLNLAKESDYAVLLDNRLGKRKIDGGYVHNGLLKAAGWVLDAECEILKELVKKYPNYTLTFAGHSLGSGVATMLTLVVVLSRDKLGNIERRRVRMGRFPPVVRTAVPVDGRFEHIVLSCNATSDHAIIWIEREATRALDLMLEKDHIMEIPVKQRMERQETLAREHTEEYKAALQRAVILAVPHAYSPSQYGTFDEQEEGLKGHESQYHQVGNLLLVLQGKECRKKTGMN
ncbi:hypothetical protein GH714_040115 [Hevea brasiliensis]|uniref:Fungal lipase-like domain-containing protein n=1 Tax=Hevea brasiliensis TaxID=3981 RepID=A0A6A6MPC7_HEVBR|nr:hypothetical protein GH714_040115 [Hevea brasiliensis]